MVDGSAGNRSSTAARIGGTFLRAAMGPVEYAAGCLLGNRIAIGLDELAPAGLMDGYLRGLSDVARLVGVHRGDVERAAPLGEARAIEERLRVSHPHAIAAWKRHAGEFGFLDVMTALTQDGRRPDLALCLDRVAGKVRHDKELAGPIAALSADVAAWADLVERTRAQLEDLGWLAAALRRRVILRATVAIAIVALLISATGAIVAIRIAEEKSSARVAAASNCDAERLTEDDLAWASREQRAEVARKIEACKDERERAEAERRREEEARAREQRARDAVLAREKACGDLAADVEAGALGEPAKGTAGEASGLLDRVAKKELHPADVGPADPKFPCGDVPAASKRIEAAYSEALHIDPMLWARRSDPSPYARKIVAKKKDDLPQNVLIGLADNAERTATAGLSGGDAATIARAKRLCAFAADLGVPGQKACRAVQNL